MVAWHQDLTISVNKKLDLPGYGPWTIKQDQYAVQPPLEILENIFTIRIHLDDTDEKNGALRVIGIAWQRNSTIFCQCVRSARDLLCTQRWHYDYAAAFAACFQSDY